MSRPAILDRVDAHGFASFSGPWNVNVIAVRTRDGVPDVFDDWLHVVYQDAAENWHDLAVKCTTDPGLYFLHKPYNPDFGTAILVAPQQARSVYRIDKHAGRYDALCQRGKNPVSVYRDRNMDSIHDHDPETITTGSNYGINVHRAAAHKASETVHNWSAGCVVVQCPLEFDAVMSVLKKSADVYGNAFTLTILKEE